MSGHSVQVSYRWAATRLLGSIGLVHAACVPEVCGQRCGATGECPSGFVCAAEHDICVPEDRRDACSDLGDLGAAGALEADPDAESRSEGDDGASPPPPPDPVSAPALAMAFSAPDAVCASDSVHVELTASGGAAEANGANREDVAGEGTYHWRLVDAPSSFSPREGVGRQLSSSGVAEQSGEIVLRVELGDGATTVTESHTLLVRERPRLATERLPALCPGERVAIELAATGGDSASYEFGASIDPALGLRVSGASLVGRVAPGALDGSTLELSLRDGHCEGDARELAIEVAPAGSEACPQLVVPGAPEPGELPPPCLGSDYEQELTVRQAGVAAGHTIREVASAPGLRFDPAMRRVHGTPLGAGTLTLAVSDASGRSIEADFPVAPREHCWLAYLADAGGPRRLHLFDPVLSEQAAARRAYPSDPGDGRVLDFAFSPRGRFLAYRVAPEEGPAALRLLDLLRWREQALGFEGAVEEYAWSGSDERGAALAVAFSSGAREMLGGLRVSAAPLDSTSSLASAPLAPASDEPASASDRLGTAAADDAVSGAAVAGDAGSESAERAVYAVEYFEPVEATVRSRPVWLDGASVAFLTPDPVFDAGGLFQSARFDRGLVSLHAPRARLEFFDGSRFMPGAAGVFAITAQGEPFFFAASGAIEVPHGSDVAISPSGAFTARALDGVLQVFRASDPSWQEADRPWAQREGCSTLLAWARGRERIACATAAAGEQRLTFFELPDPAQPRLDALGRVQGEYRFLTGQHLAKPRLFSDDGRRFAFTTDDELYLVLLEDGLPRVELRAPAVDAEVPVQLSFSARGRFFSAHAGGSLSVWNVEAARDTVGRVPALLHEPIGCSESSFGRGAPWCGAAASDRVTRWAADDDAIVYREESGVLEVQLLPRDFPKSAREVPVDDSCAEGCIVPGGYEFQP